MTSSLFVIGLVFGSFLNVAIFRYDPEKKYTLKTVGGRSHCLHCGHVLRWYELIPIVSYVLQWGKCRSCKKHISLQYPIVEIASACVFYFVPSVIQTFLFQNQISYSDYLLCGISALWIVTFLMLVAAFFIDLRHFVIPNSLNLAVGVAGLIWTALGYFLHVGDTIFKGSFVGSFGDMFCIFDSFLVGHLAGEAIAGGAFLLLVLITRGKGMGMGDVKLIAALGLLFGCPDIMLIIAISFILGTIYAIPLLFAKIKGMKDRLPFGPFIVLASFIIFFFGTRVLAYYFDIIERIGF